jgi:hypothetical protein
MHFLRSHDFGGSFSGKYFNVFDEINAAWVGSRYQFDDPEMAAIWEKIFPKNRELTRLIAQHTNPGPGNRDWCQPHWVHEDWPSPETMEKVGLMNDTATELAELVDRLEVVARRKWISTPQE